MTLIEIDDASESVKRAHILATLDAHAWNVTHAAKALGIQRSSLHRIMLRMGIVRPTRVSAVKTTRRYHRRQ